MRAVPYCLGRRDEPRIGDSTTAWWWTPAPAGRGGFVPTAEASRDLPVSGEVMQAATTAQLIFSTSI